MKKTVPCILSLIICLAPSLLAQDIGPDEEAIREIIERFTPMWTTPNGVEIFLELSSDTHYLCILENAVLTRDEFIRILEEMLKNNPPVKHTHTVRKIAISGAVAYEHGILELVRENGRIIKGEPFNVFFRGQDGWELVLSMPGTEVIKAIKD